MNTFKNILHFFNREGNTKFLNIFTVAVMTLLNKLTLSRRKYEDY